MKQRAKQNAKKNDEVNQTYCLIATGGHLWMEGYFDTLSAAVRRRLRSSPFNICPARLVVEVPSSTRSGRVKNCSSPRSNSWKR
jgi:hypothetical protein